MDDILDISSVDTRRAQFKIGGLRSGLTYGGADTIRELQRKLDYIRITPAGRHESLPHRRL